MDIRIDLTNSDDEPEYQIVDEKSSRSRHQRIRKSLAGWKKILPTQTEDNTILRKDLISRCECVVYDILEQICAGEIPKISYRIPTADTLEDLVESLESWSSQNNAEIDEDFEGHSSTVCYSQESMEVDVDGLPEPRNVVDFGRKQSKRKFVLMMTVMARIHRLLLNNVTETRRSLYYELKSLQNITEMVNSQKYIDDTVNCVANLLECSPWDTGNKMCKMYNVCLFEMYVHYLIEINFKNQSTHFLGANGIFSLGLVATAKGLAAGDLKLRFQIDEIIDYNVSGGVLIPHNVSNLISSKSKADRVLVVEKDTIFQKLLQEKCPSKLNCILVTGKGYPDVPTRMLVKILAEKVGLPVYILVDSDPHGLEIMLTYKYGSIKLCRDQGSLACPSAHWIGIHPSESKILNIPRLPLTDVDVAKLESLQSRSFVYNTFAEELNLMKAGKMEIEAISDLTGYLHWKLMP